MTALPPGHMCGSHDVTDPILGGSWLDINLAIHTYITTYQKKNFPLRGGGKRRFKTQQKPCLRTFPLRQEMKRH